MVVPWFRLVNAAMTLADAAARLRAPTQRAPSELPAVSPMLNQLETRLAGVVVAALKEAFDRDRTRLDLERDQLENERRRVEEALRLERLRQLGERSLAELRLGAIVALVIWLVSALLAGWLPAMRADLSKALLASGWAALIATLACAFVASGQLTRSLAASPAGDTHPAGGAIRWMSWLLVTGFALTAASVIAAL